MSRLLRPFLAATLLAVSLAACGGDEEPAPVLAASPTEAASEPTPEPTPSPSVTAAPSPSPEPTPTATAAPTVEPSPPPTFDDVCAGRDDEAFIEVLTPPADVTVGDPFTVEGCGNTFEANVVYEVVAADGTTLAEGFDTMTCGNGCVGEFSIEVTVGATGPVTLRVFEVSAEDGSEQSLVEVPLTIA